MTPREQLDEVARCYRSPAYFIGTYGQIYDATRRVWLKFDLWPAQQDTLADLLANRLSVVLKARQLGLSWLVLGYALWQMLFRPSATVLIFSKRDDEAVHLVDFRLKGMYASLPEWMRCREVLSDSRHAWHLSSGSAAYAFPTTGGRSYTASLVIVDEADFVPDLDALLNAVKPTIDAGGQLVLISTVDKSRPNSAFKRIYRAAKAGENEYHPVFLSWKARPERTEAWYQEQKRDVLSRTGALDDLHQEYPATDTEALAPRTLDKRIPAPWLEQCYVGPEKGVKPLAELPEDAPAIPGLTVYRLPFRGEQYVIGADPAEGNPTSDDSALTVLQRESGEEVAALAGKFQPAVLAAHADAIGTWYNRAAVMVERNNHGHAVLLWLKDNSKLQRLEGFDGKEGWHSTTKGKALLYDACADAFRNEETTLHSFTTYVQLASIEGSTLRAPEGEMDDRADSYALAIVAAARPGGEFRIR